MKNLLLKVSFLLGLMAVLCHLPIVAQSTFTMSAGTHSFTSCSAMVYDNGGPTGSYSSNSDDTLIVYPASTGCKVALSGTYYTESATWDYIKIYNGAGTSGTELAILAGNSSVTTPITSTANNGALTIVFHSDGSVQYSGFEFYIQCVGSCMCSSPMGVNATSGDHFITVSWNSSTLTHGYILEYGLHGFTPGTGTQMYTTSTSYTINNLINNTEYDIYVWYDCGNDHQITTEIPTLVSAMPMNAYIMSSGTHTLTTCDITLYDNGGPTGSYSNNSNDTLIIYPATSGCKVSLSGTYYTESASFDYIKIYDGVGVSGTELATLAGNSSITAPIASSATNGALTVVFHSDGSVQYSGFDFQVGCMGGCACGGPSGVVAVTGDQTVTLSWDAALGVGGYFVVCGPHGFTPGNGTSIFTTATSYAFNNLTNDTEYDFYVWFDCGNDHQITTEIPTFVSAIPMNGYIMSSGTHTLTTCGITIYDNGGPTGNYVVSSKDTLIIYPATAGCKLSIAGTYDLEYCTTCDYVQIYDGEGVTGTLITTLTGHNGSLTAPTFSTAANGALTIVFRSDGSLQYSGFELQVSCICNIVHIQDTVCFRERYQRYGFDTTFAYFGDYNLCRIGTDGTLTEVSLHVRPKPHVSISGGYYFCADGDITLTANNAVSYSWSTGEHSQSIQVHDIGNYQVTITDVNGCTANTYHRISPIEEFIELINFPTMCAGNSYPITGSYETGSEILMSRTQSTLTSSDTAFLPDGVPCEPYGCSYESTLTFTDYSENSVVMSEEDIYYVKINLEHSFIGDIYINITCPNGQKADIMRWSGSGSTECSSLIPASSRGWQDGGDNYTTADFGVSYDDEDYDNKCDKTAEENAPGTGWNYCWSNNTTQGYVYSSSAGSLVYRSANVHNGSVDSSNVTAGTQFYHPDESFASLIGCPLNGSWYIEVMDGWGIDNGYIFGWELALTEELLVSNSFDVSHIDPDEIWTTVTSDTSFIVSPPATLTQDTTIQYMLHFYDSDGCSFDTIVPVNIKTTHYSDTTVSSCESFTWRGTTYTQSGDYSDTVQSAAGCDSVITLHLTIDTPPSPPSVSPMTLLCPGDEVTLTAECEDAVLLTEGFSSITDGGDENAGAPGGDTIHSNTLSTFPRMSYVYPAGGKVKLGKGSYESTAIPGSMTSIPLNLSRPFEVVIRAKNWAWGGQSGGNVNGTLVVTAGSQTQTQTVNTSQYSDYTFNFNAAGLTPITIASSLPGWRLIIDTVFVKMEKECTYTWSASPETTISPNPNAQSITANPEVTTTFTLHQTSNSCTLDTSITVSVVPPPTITGGGIICEGESVTLSAECPDLVVLEEDFSMFTAENTTVNSGDIATFPTTVTVSTDAGGVILGRRTMTSTTTGEITSIPLDLTSDFSITVRAKKKDANNVEMYVEAGGVSQHQTVTSTDYADYVLSFTGQPGWAQESIHIYNEQHGGGTTGANKRLAITDVQVEMNCTYTWTATPALTMADPHAQSISVSPAETTVFSLQQTSGSCAGNAAAMVYVVPPVSISGEEWICEGDTVNLTAECSDLVVLEEDFSMCTTVNASVLNGDIPTFPVADNVRTDTDTGRVILGVGGMGTTITGEITSIPLDLTSDFKVTVRAKKKNNNVEMYVVVGGETKHQTVTSTDYADYVFSFTGQPGWGQERIHIYNELPGGDTVSGLKRLSITDVQVQVERNCTYTWTATPSMTIADPHAQSITVIPGETTVFSLSQTTNNCTQNETHTVTVRVPNHQSYSIATCGSYTWGAPDGNGQTYSATGVYLYEHEDDNGCQEVDTLHLTINQPTVGDTSAVAGDSFDWYENTNLTQSGDYTHVFAGGNAAGCDSTVTLHLTINQPTTGDTSAVECGSFDWYENSNLTESGVYTHVFVGGNAGGCDSTVTLHLTINQPTTGDTSAVECGSFDWYENSNLTQSGDYAHVFVGGNANGCDSTVTLHLTINQPTVGDTTAVECGNFKWYEHTNLTRSGDYTHVFAGGNAAGCDSTVTLHLTINQPATGDTTAVECESFDWYEHTNLTESGNYTHVFEHGAPNGCDSTVTLHLTINQPATGDTTAVECESFSWYEHTNITESGDYTHLFVGGNANGCDSTVTLHLTINQPTMGDTTAVECVSFDWYEHTNLTESGNYTHLFVGGNANGCDSTVTLHLTIHQNTTAIDERETCGDFTWINGVTYSESVDTPMVTLTSSAGCDSVVTLHLTIKETLTSIDRQESCGAYTWTDGVTYTESTTTPTQTYTSSAGCDSIVTLHLTINQPTAGDTVAVECVSFDWYEHTNITESGDYTHLFVGGNTNGCDSTLTLHLTINQPTTGDTVAVECVSFDWYEHSNITESGEYTHLFLGGNANGCDSTLTLHLTINQPATGDTTAVECVSFDWYEHTNITESGDYTHLFEHGAANGCDSAAILHLTINRPTTGDTTAVECVRFDWYEHTNITESGDYTHLFVGGNANGCDSTVTLHLTIKESTTGIDEQVACDEYTWINGITYTESTDTVTYTLNNADGCDSVVVLHLLIQKPDTIRYDSTICKGTVFREYGFDTLMTIAGTHLLSRTLYAQQTRCDTLVELTLHVNEPAVINTVAQSVCPSSSPVVVVAQFQNVSGYNNTVTWTSNSVVETHNNVVTPLNPKDSFAVQLPLNLCDDSLFYTVEYSDGICTVTESNLIHVVDTIPPVVNGVLAQLNLQGCSAEDVPSAYMNAGEINALDNISIADNCTSLENITVRHLDSVVSSLCDISIIRTYTLTDACGNATHLEQNIMLTRTSDFTISQVDTADTITCFSMALADNIILPEVKDACGNVLQPSGTPAVSGLDGSCEGAVRYTFTYRNCSGGDTAWTFTYHIALPDIFTGFPVNGEGEVQCLADVSRPSVQSVQDACGHFLTVTFLGSTENVNPDGSGTVAYQFRYSDCAGHDSVWTYTYTLTPNQFTPKPDLFDTVHCVSEALDDTIPVVTNCGTPVVLVHGVDTNRVVDGCGDMAFVYNYTVNDDHYTWTHYYHVAPEPFVRPDNREFYVQCLDSAAQVVPPVVVNACSDTIHPIALPVSIHSDGCTGYVTYAWDYADCSGDTVRWTCTYVVADTTPPTFIVPADITICRDTNGTYDADPAVTGIAIRFSDNCSSLQEISRSCQDLLVAGANGVDTLLRQWIVKDNCDNANVQTQRITIMPVRYTTIVDSICEGEVYDTLNFNFVANVDTVVYQTLMSQETGCDSLVTLNLTVHHPVHESDSATAINVYTWNGTTYTQSGMYTYHHPDIHNCDQVDTLFLTIHHTSSLEIYDTACDRYTWDGVEYTESGVFTRHFTNEFNADSTVILHLTINQSKDTIIRATVCYTYQWNDSVYTETGVYEQRFQTSTGCDSIVTLELRVNYNKDTIIHVSACEEYRWYDTTYTESGIYMKTLESSDLCDSTVIMYLTINHNVTSDWWDTVCNVKQWNNEIYTESGEYVQHLESVFGCDSAVTLHLVVNHSDTTAFDAASCDTYTWENVDYVQSGDYTRTFANQFGCDSVVTMHLAIHSATSSTLYDTIAQNSLPYDTLGMHFTAAGTMQDTILNQYGCDSIVTMHLFVAQNIVVDVDRTICENDLPYTWNHVVFNQAGTMNDTLTATNGSDSIIVMTLNVNSNTYSTENEFVIENNLPHVFNGHTFTGPVTNEQIVIPNANGCDSIITYSLQVWYNVKDTVERTICENDIPYSWNNVQFTASGMQNVVFTLPNGADSVLTMVLFVHNNTQSTIYDTIVENGLPYDTLDMHFSDAGTLSDTIANANGCDSIVTMHLYVWYNVANTVDSTVCENNLPIVWNDVVFEAAGENTIVLVGNHGVDSVVTMRLAVIPKDVSVFHDEVCEGRDYFGHGFVVPGNQTVHIPGHHLSIENTFENELGCDSVVRLELDVVDTTVYIRPLFDFCDNLSTTLSVYTQLTDYVWSTGETSQNIDVTAPGLYSVTAMQGDCQSEAVISIEDCPTKIYLPNAITPGKLDGHNDCFSLPERYQNMIDEFEITIFNRWGQPVFHSKDKAFKWYGEYKDNVYRQNVYEYLIDYTENNRFHRKVKLRGSVVVL